MRSPHPRPRCSWLRPWSAALRPALLALLGLALSVASVQAQPFAYVTNAG